MNVEHMIQLEKSPFDNIIVIMVSGKNYLDANTVDEIMMRNKVFAKPQSISL